MGTVKSAFGVLGALLPIIYCGGLAFYFIDFSGSPEDVRQNGLGPTVLGLTIVGLIFCIPLLLKLVRIFIAPRPPGYRSGPDASPNDDAGGFDADAVIARYLSRQSSGAGLGDGAQVRPAQQGGRATQRTGFGRKAT